MIRSYKEPDMDILIHIWLSASIEAHSFIPSSYWESKIDDMKTIYIPSSETYVVEEESSGEIKGFISLLDNYLAALFIDPLHQRKGIGKELVNFAKLNRTALKLNVYKDNYSAIKFYEKQDFIIIEEQTDTATGKKEVVMEWRKL